MSDGPVWERGHRCHGYWLCGKRIGFIGLQPWPYHAAIYGYTWYCDVPENGSAKGQAKSLRQAKRAVERFVHYQYGDGNTSMIYSDRANELAEVVAGLRDERDALLAENARLRDALNFAHTVLSGPISEAVRYNAWKVVLVALEGPESIRGLP